MTQATGVKRLSAVLATLGLFAGLVVVSAQPAGANALGEPTNLVVIGASTTTLTVSFSPPTGDTSSITNYQYSTDGTTWTNAGTSSPFTFTPSGAAANTAYTVRLRAVAGATTGAVAFVETATLSNAPTITQTANVAGSASTAGNGTQATLTFTAPANTGSATITDYEFSIDSGSTWSSLGSTSSPATVTGLTGNTVYSAGSIRLRAVNAGGGGTAAQAGAVTTTPDVPTGVVATRTSNTNVDVSFTAQQGGGAQTITTYQVSLDGTTWVTRAAGTTASPISVAVVNGTSYPNLRIRAVTASGSGSAAAAPASSNGANPTITAVAAQSTTAIDVGFFTSTTTNINRYEYSTDGGTTFRARQDGQTTASPLAITSTSAVNGPSLAANTVYPVQIRSVRSNGNILGTSASVNGTTLPGQLQNVQVSAVVGSATTSGNSSELQATFDTLTGNATLRSLEYSVDGGSTWTTTSDVTSPITLSGLQPNRTYTSILLRAVNDGGTGAPSAAVSATTAAPAPIDVTVASVDGAADRLSVALTPPASGGLTVTGYEYRVGDENWASVSNVAGSWFITSLQANTAFGPFEFRTVTSAGSGSGRSARTSSATTVAAAPTFSGSPVTAVSNSDTELELTFAAPAGDGITGYEYSTNGGVGDSWTATSDVTSPITLTVPTSNTTYSQIVLRAVTAAGKGVTSAAVTGTTRPAAPGSPSRATSTASSVSVSFAAPTPATDLTYEYSTSGVGGPWKAPESTSTDGSTVTAVITSLSDSATALTAGAAATVHVRGVRGALNGLPSAASVSTATLPASPTGLAQSSGGSGSVTLSFTAPSGPPSGSASVTGYEYSLDGGPWVATGSTSTSPTVAGLSSGTSYSVQVRALNVGGAGSASASLNVATVTSAPPAIASFGGPGAGQISLRWSAPATTGAAAALTGYSLECRHRVDVGFDPADPCSQNGWNSLPSPSASAISQVVSNLTAGAEYEFRLRAVNAAGSSQFATTKSYNKAPVDPVPPTNVTVTPGDRSATVRWNRYSDADAGYQSVFFRVSVVGNASLNCTAQQPRTGNDGGSCTVSGLTNGTAYKFVVTATNSVGSATSAETGLFTPSTIPGAPAAPTGSAGVGSASLTWTAPTSTGGAAISSYAIQYSTNGGTSWTNASTDPASIGGGTLTATVTGLTNGTSYIFRVRASNFNGAGLWSASSAPVVPRTVPGAPTITTVAAGNASAVVRWMAPASDGGAAVTGYRVAAHTLVSGSWVASGQQCAAGGSASSCTVTGLTNGIEYRFGVFATNVAGEGARSSLSGGAIPVEAASAPAPVTGTVGDRSVLLSWSVPSSLGGGTLVRYEIRRSDDGGQVWSSPTTVAPGSTSATVNELTNGSSYVFSVVAVTNGSAGGELTSPPAFSPALVPVTGPEPTKPTLSPSSVGVGRSVSTTLSATGLEAGATAVSVDPSVFTVSGGPAEVAGSMPLTLTGVAVGTASLLVTNPGGRNCTITVTVTDSLGGLSVTTTPASIAVGTQRAITVGGTGILPGATIANLGAGMSVVGSPSVANGVLNVTLSVTGEAVPGSRSFDVVNLDGATASVTNLTVDAQPTASAPVPSTVPAGSTGSVLSITGTGFALGAIFATLPGVGATGTVTATAAQFVSATSYTVVVSASADASGSWTLRMANRNGGVAQVSFSISSPLTVSGVRLSSSSAESPVSSAQQGQTVALTLTGNGIGMSPTVRFSGTGLRVASLVRVNATTLTFNLIIDPIAAVGARSVTVRLPDGQTATLSSAFTINAA